MKRLFDHSESLEAMLERQQRSRDFEPVLPSASVPSMFSGDMRVSQPYRKNTYVHPTAKRYWAERGLPLPTLPDYSKYENQKSSVEAH